MDIAYIYICIHTHILYIPTDIHTRIYIYTYFVCVCVYIYICKRGERDGSEQVLCHNMLWNRFEVLGFRGFGVWVCGQAGVRVYVKLHGSNESHGCSLYRVLEPIYKPL